MNNKKRSSNDLYGTAAVIFLGIAVVFFASKLVSINSGWLESFSKNGGIDSVYKYVILGITALLAIILFFLNRKNLPNTGSPHSKKDIYSYVLIIFIYAITALISGYFVDLSLALIFFVPGIFIAVKNIRAKKS
jgi:hypothetical protein